MRYSVQRDTIVRILRESCDHPTADMIYARVRREMPNISLGTVYRNLKGLADTGEICTVETLDKSIHYDGCTEPHRHFVCEGCAAITDLYFKSALPAELDALGLLVHSEKTIYYGLCPECRKAVCKTSE